MKLRIISDLHLDINRDFELKEMEGEEEQVLLIAGDVAPLRNSVAWNYVHELSERFKKIIIIPGNHEYYGDFLNNPSEPAKANINSLPFNVSFRLTPEKSSLLGINKIGIVMGTLWTDYDNGDPVAIQMIQNSMNDYRAIYEPHGRSLATPRLIMDEHEKQMRRFRDLMDTTPESFIIGMSHHAPTWESVNEKFVGSPINGAFVTNALSLLADANIWIHGHTHASMDYYSITGTRVICNPVGYRAENSDFDHYKIIEV